MATDDFASFMEAPSAARVRRLRQGERVQGPVVQVSGDSVFVDLGGRAEGRVPRAELCDASGALRVNVGDPLEATVLDPNAEGGPLLAVTMGRDQRLDLASLQLAMDSRTPVDAHVVRAVKAGLEVDVGGARGFCPASQVERGYVADLDAYAGQTLRVLVTEVKEGDRSVVVSRRRALELEREQVAERTLARLAVGQDLEGTVSSVQPYGAFVDLGGIEGLVHISELSHARVDRVEDVLSPGETVHVRVLAIEEGDKGKRIRLSLKALQQVRAAPAPQADQVLAARVVRLLPHGVIVQTEQGEGLVPKRELELPAGADHRRAYKIDQPLEVVVLDGREGRYRFSQTRVEEVRSRKDFLEYRRGQSEPPAAGSGTLGAALLGAVDRSRLPRGPAPTAAPKATPAEPAVPGKSATTKKEDARGRRRIVSSRGKSS